MGDMATEMPKDRVHEALVSIRERAFVATSERYMSEYKCGKVSGSNFPYHIVKDQPGYAERNTPSLNATDVAKEIARYLLEFVEGRDVTFPYTQRQIAIYLWMQASRGLLEWEQVLSVVRAARKRERSQSIAHYFGYHVITDTKGAAKHKKLIKMVRYITQEGECVGCQVEFPFEDLTLDRIVPGAAYGAYDLHNVQLMCQPCNGRKGSNY